MKELDFLPRSFLEAIRRRRANRRNVLYSLAVVTALAVLHTFTMSDIRSARAALAASRDNAGLRNSQHIRVAVLKQTRGRLQARAETLGMLADDAPLDVVLAEINRLMGPTTALRNIALETQPPPEPAPDPKAKDVKPPDPIRQRGPTNGTLQALAASDMEVGIFFGRISSSPLFDNVRLNYSREAQQSGRSAREFELTFSLRPVTLPEDRAK